MSGCAITQQRLLVTTIKLQLYFCATARSIEECSTYAWAAAAAVVV